MMRFLIFLFLTLPAYGQFGFIRHVHRDNRTNIPIAGLQQSLWVNTGGIVGNNTIANGRWLHTFKGPTVVTMVRYSVNAIGTSNEIKFKVWRGLATNNYIFVGESEKITNSVAATNDYWLVASISAQENDTFGFWQSGGATPLGIRFSNRTATRMHFTALDVTATQAPWVTQSEGVTYNVNVYGLGPALGYLTDSQMTGYPNYYPHMAIAATDGATTATNRPSNGVPYKVWQAMPFNYIQYGRGQQTMHWVNNTAMPVFTNDNPAHAWLHGVGGNDITLGTNYANYEIELNAIRAKIPRNKRMWMTSILPGAVYDDTEAATRRTFNTNNAAWCQRNGVYWVDLESTFGSNRVSTSHTDDLKPEYDSGDGAHMSALGNDKYAEVVRGIVRSYVK